QAGYVGRGLAEVSDVPPGFVDSGREHRIGAGQADGNRNTGVRDERHVVGRVGVQPVEHEVVPARRGRGAREVIRLAGEGDEAAVVADGRRGGSGRERGGGVGAAGPEGVAGNVADQGIATVARGVAGIVVVQVIVVPSRGPGD